MNYISVNQHLLKLAILVGTLGLVLTAFLIIVYYAHLGNLPDVSIEAIRYAASTLSAAIAFFVLSLGMGLIALASYRERKSSRLMLVSTVTAIIGYVFPCERLWRLSYTRSLNETIIIATVHVALLISSAFLLKTWYKRTHKC